MLFIGTSEHTIDPKQRLAIPAKYRNQWDPNRDGTAWVAIPWPGSVIRLYTSGDFEKLSSSAPNTLTPGRAATDFEASFFGFAERLDMDSNGRVTLPKKHLDLTKLGSEVVIVGARNRLEIRDKARWLAEELQRFERLDALSEQLGAQ